MIAFVIKRTVEVFLYFVLVRTSRGIFSRGGSRAAATSKMECFVKKPLTIITKHSILDVAAVLDPPLFRTLSNI